MTNKSKKILTEISAGELLDKISILEIKLDNIKDDEKLTEINKEYKSFLDCLLILTTSLKPWVVIKSVFAPLCCKIEFVATVVILRVLPLTVKVKGFKFGPDVSTPVDV